MKVILTYIVSDNQNVTKMIKGNAAHIQGR